MPVSDSARVPGGASGRHDCGTLLSRGNQTGSVSEAVILIDKPQGWTSTDVVRRLRRSAGTRRVGHAGTLDPMATGLLVCMTGRCTKLSRIFLEMDKEYVGTMRLGQSTPSYDADTPVETTLPADHITIDDLTSAAARRMGMVVQQTPPYAAVKVSGERLYHRARRGDRRSGPPRVVTIDLFEISEMRGCDVDFRLVCSKGTYVRALAHEIGQELGVGAHLVSLRRVRIGDYSVVDAIPMEEMDALDRKRDDDAAREDDHAG